MIYIYIQRCLISFGIKKTRPKLQNELWECASLGAWAWVPGLEDPKPGLGTPRLGFGTPSLGFVTPGLGLGNPKPTLADPKLRL